MGKVTQLFDARQFQAGLIGGLIAVAVVLVVAAATPRNRRPAIAGVPVALAGLAALQGWGPWRAALKLPDRCVVGVALLAVGGLVVQYLQRRRQKNLLVPAVAFTPGAVLLGLGLDGVTHRWAAVAVAVSVPLFAALADDSDQFHRRRAFGPLFIVVTIAGIYATVPDTEGSRALLGAAIPLFAVVLPRPAATLGASGTAAMIGLALTVAAIEGAPRPGAIVGALGCIGMLAADPIGRRVLPELRHRDGHDPDGHLRYTLVALVIQGAVVGWASRVAGFSTEALQAAGVLLVGAAGSVWAAAALPKPPLPTRGVRR